MDFIQNDYTAYDFLPCCAVSFNINSLDIVYSNNMFKNTFGNKNTGVFINLPENEREIFLNMPENTSDPDYTYCTYFKIICPDKKETNVRASVIRLSSDIVFALLIDDSKTAAVLKRLNKKCNRYASAIIGSDEILFEYNHISDINTVFFSSRGRVFTKYIKNFFADLDNNKYIFDKDKSALSELVKNIDSGNPCIMQLELRIRTHSSAAFEWYRLKAKPDKNNQFFVGSIRNINSDKAEEEKLREKALIDPLSKVYNRAAAIEKIEQRLNTISSEVPCALIVFDIDNFKHINDTFGHLYGDAVISMAAGCIKSALNENDIIGRFGGDEFFAYIENAEKNALEKKLERIRLAILKMRFDKNNNNDISCSIGIAMRTGGQSYEELFRQADSALYSAKNHGKNRYEYFSGQYSEDGALSYAAKNINSANESNTAHNIVTVALEIAAKSTNAENAVSNILRHTGISAELDCIQIMKFDTIEDKIFLEFQWWREHNGIYNVVFTDKKSGYYTHNDLSLFKNRLKKEKSFVYTPDFKKDFSQKYKNVLSEIDNINVLYSSNNESDNLFYLLVYQRWDKSRAWAQQEINDLQEITKIISIYLNSLNIVSEREKMLIRNIEYDKTGLYQMEKFYEEAGRIIRDAQIKNKKLAVLHCDFVYFYKFNMLYGRKTGDNIIVSFSKFLLQEDNNAVSMRPGGTDMFITLFSFDNSENLESRITDKLNEFCGSFGVYKEHPLVIKAGLCFFEPGIIIADAIDTAKHIKRNLKTDKCVCIVSEKPDAIPFETQQSELND